MNSKDLSELNFKDDLINRNENFASGLESIIKSADMLSNNNSLVLAIDSGWGTGKTWLMHMFKNGIENEEYSAIYYNAWENDDWENALIPIVARINDIKNSLMESDKGLVEKINEKSIEVSVFLKYNWKSLIFNSISQVLKKLTSFDIKEIKKIWDESWPDFSLTRDYENFVEAKNDFKKELEALGKHKKIIFIIDELDRCKPTFAIETLEVVKHFFDIKNFSFIFSLDMMQLSHSVATIYGQNMDAEGYLRRFFDFQLKLPSFSTRLYIQSLIKTEILPIYAQKFISIETMRNNIIDIFEHFNLSIRDINIIYNNFLVFMNYYKIFDSDDVLTKINIYLFFIVIKYKQPIIYDLILHKPYTLDSTNQEYKLDISYYRFNTDIAEFLSKFKNRMHTEIYKIPHDSLNIHDYINKIKLGSINEHEKMHQYLERHLEILKIENTSNESLIYI